MPATRLVRDTTVDGQLLINKAIRKAGDIEKLSIFIGYTKETLISIRATGLVSRRLQKVLKEYIETQPK